MKSQSWWERIRSSLFYVPFMFSLLGIVLGEVMLQVDARIDAPPDRLLTTVDSARSVLTTIAGATLAFAAIAFSVSLLLVSAASSQFSPRVVHGLFRDPFNKRVMGVVVGTFVYCLVVLRAVRGPLEDAGDPIIPNLAVVVAVGLALVAILSIIAFINHSAHGLEVSTLLHRVTEEALEHLRRTSPDADGQKGEGLVPDGSGCIVRFDRHGWVQSVDHAALLAAVPASSTIQLETAAGRYAIEAVPICEIWPQPDDEEDVAAAVRAAITVGPSRTMQQDLTYGVRQLADVALKALSPGINDPTTAQDAMFHLASVVREILSRPAPERRTVDENDRTLLRPDTAGPAEVVGLAFDEIRLASAGSPTVLIYLLEILALLLRSSGEPVAPAASEALRAQAALVLEVAKLGELPEADRARVRVAYAKRFADGRLGSSTS